MGRKPHLQSIRTANTANPVHESGARSSWFQFLGRPRVCFFFWSCRARSRLRRSSKRFVFDWQFPHIGEWVRAKTLGVFKTKQTQQQTNTQPKPNQNNPKRHPGNYVKHYAFRKVPKPLSTASRCYSKSHS